MKILVIEDEKETRDFLKISLQAESFIVDTAEDGERGSYLARVNDYNLIILDNILPKKTAQLVCAEIRNAKVSTPILLLSIQSDIAHKVRLLQIGADDYMTKPFAFDELLARIHALLRRPKELQETTLEVDDLILCSQTQKVHRGKKRIYLTRKEFDLLEYLMQNKGHVLTRTDIMEHVWNVDCDLFSNTLEAHILNVRKKIENPRLPRLIHNIPGRGYKIDALE
jgi:two-component system, OmpR family, copper resistance phosphate regulon response regulator CusR